MSNYKNRFQSNSKLDKEWDNLSCQSFNVSDLKRYSEEQAVNFLREFDRTPRRLRQYQINYYKEWLNYLSIFASNINLITLNKLRD